MFKYCTRFVLYNSDDLLVREAFTRSTLEKFAKKLGLSSYKISEVRFYSPEHCEVVRSFNY